jgi:S-DNA-T family DNA segregation ATPase FtsK/SpoIIIE
MSPTRKPTRTSQRTRSPKKAQGSDLRLFPWNLPPLSKDRKLDITGGVLAFLGLLTFIGMIASTKGSVLAPVVNGLYTFAGYAAFLLPLTFLIVGVWLILRRSEKLPHFSFERFLGIILLLFNIFTFLYILSGAYGQAVSGYMGYLIGSRLKAGFGILGSLVILLAWFLIAMALTLDVSVPDLLRKFGGLIALIFVRKRSASPLNGDSLEDLSLKIKPGQARIIIKPTTGETVHELPREFKPLSELAKPVQTGISREKPAIPVPSPTKEKESQIERKSSPFRPGTAQTSAAKSNWQLPSIETILDPTMIEAVHAGVDQSRARTIEETLKVLGAPGKVVDIQRGPTVTRFGVEPEYLESRSGDKTRVRVAQISKLTNDLSLALAAQVRIQAPVPGKGFVGIEVPNLKTSLVGLREIMESGRFKQIHSRLRFALGKDVSGQPFATDLEKMPHLLIAGTTGSGKSVCVNAILACLLLSNDPTDLKMLLIDPKRVELTGYNGIPHLLAPVVVDIERVLGALTWITTEMDNRYLKFNKSGVRNIQEYNAKGMDKLPFIIVVIDELADLMMLAQYETEKVLTRLAQMARATGIHLIISTQRPSANVVTGNIKANFSARIAFMVASNVDSRVILDTPGADRLVGRGDMLFQAPDSPAPVRLQGAFVSNSEIERLVDWWRVAAMHASPESKSTTASATIPVPQNVPFTTETLNFEKMTPSDEDPMLEKAKELVRREGKASISMLQRKMGIGYMRASRIIDRMEEQKIIGPSQANSQVREILDWGRPSELPPPNTE